MDFQKIRLDSVPALATEVISSILLPHPALKLCQTEIQKKNKNFLKRTHGENI